MARPNTIGGEFGGDCVDGDAARDPNIYMAGGVTAFGEIGANGLRVVVAIGRTVPVGREELWGEAPDVDAVAAVYGLGVNIEGGSSRWDITQT